MVAIVGVLLVAAPCGRADAGAFIEIEQVGSNVVLTGSGSINLTGMTFKVNDNGVGSGVGATSAAAFVGPSSGANVDLYVGSSGPPAFGSNGFTFSSSGTGDLFGVFRANFFGGVPDGIEVPHGYTSGASLSGTAVMDNATLSSLGLNVGTYIVELPNDSITVNIGPTPVPEPSSLLMAGTAVVAGLGVWARRRGRRAA